MSVVRYRSEEPVGSLRFHFVTTVIGDDNVQHRTWAYTLSHCSSFCRRGSNYKLGDSKLEYIGRYPRVIGPIDIRIGIDADVPIGLGALASISSVGLKPRRVYSMCRTLEWVVATGTDLDLRADD